MASAAGIIINVAAERQPTLLEAIEYGDGVSEAVPEFKHSRNVPLIAFISFKKGKITHLARARRGIRAATGLSRLNFDDVIELPRAIAISDILPAVPNKLRHHAEQRFKQGGLLPPATFIAVVDAIRRLSEVTRPILDRFSRERRQRIAALSSGARTSLAYQKETLATALALADLDRAELQVWQPVGTAPAEGGGSFLDGLPAARLREDPMVINDMAHVPGFEQIRTMKYGAAVFENDKTRLTVVLANRLPLEKQLGADLI